MEIRLRQRLGEFNLDVALASEADGVTAIFGPSGSGKTSLINAIAGLTRPDEGYIRVGDRVLVDTVGGVFVKPHQRRVGYVFQDARLFPHLSVARNLSYAGQGTGRLKTPELATVLGIDHLLERMPGDLSGGEAQRVAIGRALMSDPDILLMDEPLASLDQGRRDEILPLLDQLHGLSGVQIIYVSHAMSEVARLSDTIVLMKEGRVSAAGPTADILSDPALVPEIGVREAGAVLSGTLVTADAGDGLSELEMSNGRLLLPRISAAEGSLVRVRILASDVILSKERPNGLSALNILPARVAEVQDGAGPGVAVALRCGEDRLVARITRRSAEALGIRPGSSCFAVIKSVSVARGSISVGK